MFKLKKAKQRYRVAKRLGLSTKLCVRAFFFGKGTPKENFNKAVNKPKPLAKASEVGKIIINKYLERGFTISTQKLSKLLILIQVECIEKSGFPLFPEGVSIWDCGPIIREVNEDFKHYDEYFANRFDENVTLLNAERRYIDNILEKYWNSTVDELNRLSIMQKISKMGRVPIEGATPYVSTVRLTEEFAKRNVGVVL